MQGDSGKRGAHTGTLRKRSKKKTEKVIPLYDRCEDTEPEDWGPWYYDGKLEMLVCKIPGYESTYEIDLDRCQTSVQKCDWLAQIAEKSWATRDVLGGLVQALYSSVGLRPELGER